MIEERHERRILNEGIERAYLDSAGYAASLRTHYQTGSGTIRDLFELFYFNVSVLYDLTSDLTEMHAEVSAKKQLEDWLSLPRVKSADKEMEERCRNGLISFRDYKIALSKNGVLTLPR